MLHEAEHLPKHTINHIPISLNAKAAMGFMRERSRANELTLRHYFVDMMRKAIVVVFVAALTMSISAQGLIAGSVTSAVAFPKPDRPVADIVSPIWHDEKERDDAGEPRQLVRLLGIKSGMTIADIGAGSGYYVAVPDRRSSRPHHRTRCRTRVFAGPAQAGARSRIAECYNQPR